MWTVREHECDWVWQERARQSYATVFHVPQYFMLQGVSDEESLLLPSMGSQGKLSQKPLHVVCSIHYFLFYSETVTCLDVSVATLMCLTPPITWLPLVFLSVNPVYIYSPCFPFPLCQIVFVASCVHCSLQFLGTVWFHGFWLCLFSLFLVGYFFYFSLRPACSCLDWLPECDLLKLQ